MSFSKNNMRKKLITMRQQLIAKHATTIAPTTATLPSRAIARPSRQAINRPPINDNPSSNGEIAFYKQNKHLFKTIFIVGAAHDEDYINSTSPDVQFHLFEPNVERYQVLLRTLGHKPNVTIQSFGLSDQDGVSDYYADTLSCVKRTHDIQSKSTPVQISLRRLDDYCQEQKIEQIDFLKIDTEGYEYPILIGGSNILKQTQFVQFEYGGCWKDTHYFLQSLYQQFPNKRFGELMPDGSWQDRPNAIEDFRYTNYIMTNK